MKLEENKIYLTRLGAQVGPLRRRDDSTYPWEFDGNCWTREGKIREGLAHDDDLISEYTDPTAGNPMSTQVGGSNYKDMAIQPMEYSMRNNLNACQHTAIKYVSRYKDKGGKQDLEKAIHTIQMLIAMEYPESTASTSE